MECCYEVILYRSTEYVWVCLLWFTAVALVASDPGINARAAILEAIVRCSVSSKLTLHSAGIVIVVTSPV